MWQTSVCVCVCARLYVCVCLHLSAREWEWGREGVEDREKQWNISRALNLCVLFSNPVGLNLLRPFRMWPFLNSPHNFPPRTSRSLSTLFHPSPRLSPSLCAARAYFGEGKPSHLNVDEMFIAIHTCKSSKLPPLPFFAEASSSPHLSSSPPCGPDVLESLLYKVIMVLPVLQQ